MTRRLAVGVLFAAVISGCGNQSDDSIAQTGSPIGRATITSQQPKFETETTATTVAVPEATRSAGAPVFEDSDFEVALQYLPPGYKASGGVRENKLPQDVVHRSQTFDSEDGQNPIIVAVISGGAVAGALDDPRSFGYEPIDGVRLHGGQVYASLGERRSDWPYVERAWAVGPDTVVIVAGNGVEASVVMHVAEGARYSE